MRRLVCCLLCGAVTLGALGLTACRTELPRDRYDIVAEYLPEERLLRAEMNVEICNRTDTAFFELQFHLWPNAYREGAAVRPVSELYAPAVYYAGTSYGGICVSEVVGGDFRVGGEDENVLIVTPPAPVYPEERIALSMRFEVILPLADHRLGVGERAVTLADFYPVLCPFPEGASDRVYAPVGDPFTADCADYTVSLTLPAQFTAAYTGAGERTEQNGKACYRVTARNVRSVAFVFSEHFSVAHAVADGIPVDYYYWEGESPARVLDAAVQSLSYFSQTFGPYSYGRYTLVRTDLPYGGMEYPMLTMLGDGTAGHTPFVVAHETAHQWWGASVGSDPYTQAWQDEGLAEFSAALFMETHPAYGEGYRQIVSRAEGAYRAFFSVQSQISQANTAMSRPLTAYTGDYEYRRIAYDKALILFDRLRETMGDKKLFAALRDYAACHAGRLASSADLIACLVKKSRSAEGIAVSFLDGRCVI